MCYGVCYGSYKFFVLTLKNQVNSSTEDIDGAAGAEAGLNITEAAGGLPVDVNVLILQF